MASEILVLARIHYNKAKTIITKLSELAQKNNNKFKLSIAMKQFDYILQLSLLHATVFDRDFDSIELEFVKDITEYGSIVALFNAKMKEIVEDFPQLTWQNFPSIISRFSEKQKNNFLKQIYGFVDDLAADFVKWFAPIDAEDKEVDYLKQINECFESIIAVLTGRDGKPTEVAADEVAAAAKLKKSVLLDRWRRAVEDNS